MSKRKLLAAVATVAASALVFTGCTPPAKTGDPGKPATTGGTVTVAWNQEFYAYNADTTYGNATANNNIRYMSNDSLFYYDKDLNIVDNKSFGSYEKLSDDPLTVKVTFADTASWSDGAPVTAADGLLTWGALSGHFNTAEVETDDEGGVKENPEGKVFFNASSAGMALIKDFPEIGDNGKSLTFTFSKPYVDWQYNLLAPGLPAHVVAKRALGEADPAKAAEALINAFKNKDAVALSKISNVWNNDFNFADMPADKELVVGTGPFVITDLKDKAYVTLEKNANYKGEHKPKIDKVTVKIIPKAQDSVTALRNGEVLVTQPQATADILTQLEGMKSSGINVSMGMGATFEHVDLQFANGGPFDPKTYGGDAEKAKKVREAFLNTIPRQEIIDKIIKPLNPNAELRNTFIAVPGSPNYDDAAKANGMQEKYGEGKNIDKAKALLAEAGVPAPTVRILYASNNERRVQEFQLMKAAAEAAGFKIEDAGNEKWGGMLSSAKDKYDAALFGWQSTSLAVGESDANFRTGGLNNFYGYSNKETDALLDELQVAVDPAKQKEIVEKVEKILTDDAFGITIFQFPEITGSSNKLEGMSSIPLAPTLFWEYWNWTVAAQ